MDGFSLQSTYGLEKYREAEEYLGKICVESVSLGHNLILYKMGDHEVLHRDYPDGGDPSYDCDCRCGDCKHIIAVRIHEMKSNPSDPRHDDKDTILELEEMIDGIRDMVYQDPDYDEEDNYYEDWEIEKYGIETYNEDVEYDNTREVLAEIVSRIKEPDNLICLFDRLACRIGHDFEYDNGGFDRAFGEFDKEIRAAFAHARTDTVALVSSHDDHMCYWAHRYIEDLGKTSMDEAYRYNRDHGIITGAVVKGMLEAGDYEDYVNNSDNKGAALLDVEGRLRGKDDDRLKRIVAGHEDAKTDYGREVGLAELFEFAGIPRKAAEIYKELYDGRPCAQYLDGIRRNEPGFDGSLRIDSLVKDAEEADGLRYSELCDLVSLGRKADVCRIVREKGARPCIGFRKPDYGGSEGLVYALISAGCPEEAALVGRGVIESVLSSNNNRIYDFAVGFLKRMNDCEELENVSVPQSDYVGMLKLKFPRHSKFWGIYNGTYRDPNKRSWYW